jgi:hypothetical protein
MCSCISLLWNLCQRDEALQLHSELDSSVLTPSLLCLAFASHSCSVIGSDVLSKTGKYFAAILAKANDRYRIQFDGATKEVRDVQRQRLQPSVKAAADE